MHDILNILDTTELLTLKCLILVYVNFTSTKRATHVLQDGSSVSSGPQKTEWKARKANLAHFYLFPSNLIQPGKVFKKDTDIKDSWLIKCSILHSELLV